MMTAKRRKRIQKAVPLIIATVLAALFLAPLIAGLSGGAIPDAPPWQLRHAMRQIPKNGPREAFLCAPLSYEGAAICDRQDALARLWNAERCERGGTKRLRTAEKTETKR